MAEADRRSYPLKEYERTLLADFERLMHLLNYRHQVFSTACMVTQDKAERDVATFLFDLFITEQKAKVADGLRIAANERLFR